MRIRLLILTLLIIGVHQHIQAQYMLGTTGMMNIPTADRQKPGTVMLGGNYLPKQMMPARFDYNTGNYFVSISFFSFLELAYRETLIKGDYVSSKPKYNQQDRSYSIRLCVWKEGKFLPGIALGANDPIADKGANTFQSYYGVITIIRKSKFPQNPKRSVRFSGKGTKRSVQKRKARNTQKAETKVL